MTTGVFLAVLFAALLHAGWNAAIKFGTDKFQGMMLLSLGHLLVGLVMIAVYPVPDASSWGFLAASVAFHTLYKLFLAAAYEHGDLSRVYPIARGAAPIFVLIVSGLLLSDVMAGPQVAGILVVGGGILLLARGVFRHGEAPVLIGLSLMSAIGTAGYSIFDGLGARASGSVGGYIGWLFVLDPLIFLMIGLWRRGTELVPRAPRAWAMGLVAACASVGSYWIAVWAMTVAPIALVTALRETSVLFAVLIGILVFRERADRGKLVAAAVIVGGIILIRI